MADIKIDQKIVSHQVLGEQPAPKELADVSPRPEILEGTTYKLKSALTGDSALYITINDLKDPSTMTSRPFEIFINSKNMEHYQWVIALTRMMSAVFRKGGDVSFVIEELQSVVDPRGGYLTKDGYIPSLVAEIGGIVKLHLDRLNGFEGGVVQQLGLLDEQSPQLNLAWCGKCSTYGMKAEGGCDTCVNCGYSKCG